jgi:hypothetical protein
MSAGNYASLSFVLEALRTSMVDQERPILCGTEFRLYFRQNGLKYRWRASQFLQYKLNQQRPCMIVVAGGWWVDHEASNGPKH